MNAITEQVAEVLDSWAFWSIVRDESIIAHTALTAQRAINRANHPSNPNWTPQPIADELTFPVITASTGFTARDRAIYPIQYHGGS